MLKWSRTVAVAVLLSATACSADGPEKVETLPSKSPTAVDTGIISPELPKNPRFKGTVDGIIKDVAVESCDLEEGTVRAAGTATNSAQNAQDIVVSISWAVPTTSDVVARGIAILEDVKAGETLNWDVEAELGSSQTVACVPTALRGTLR